MDTLWAPWRADYVMEAKPAGCVFCLAPGRHDDSRTFVLHRGQHCFIILNAYPYNNGHLMIVPYRHIADLSVLDAQAATEMMALTQRSLVVLRDALHPAGFNVGVNMGNAAGAGIADHVHLHVVPRWVGDSNFMTVVGDTRVLPQSLAESYRLLAPAFARNTTDHDNSSQADEGG